MLRAAVKSLLPIRPRALMDAWLTYPRYLGTIKPTLLRSNSLEIEARLRSFEGAWWPKVLACPVGRRILVVAPHPDDESIGAGGFLLRHREQAEIHLVTIFDGSGGGRLERGPYQDDPEYKRELVAERRAEIERVARRFSARSLQHLDLPDGTATPTLEAADRLRAAVDRVRPDVVLLPWFLDRQRDHRVANILYAWSCADVAATVYGFEIWHMLQPNAVLDVSEVFEEKLELVRSYKTQTATIDYANMVEGLAKVRAFASPVNPARTGAVEGFFALPNREYCALVTSLYGTRGVLRPETSELL